MRRLPEIFVAVTLTLVFGPALLALGSSFLGYETVDHYGTQWFYWFALHHLQRGESPAHTDLFFYPWGKDIYGHTGANMLDAWFAVPFRAVFGPVLGYNLPVLVGLAASAWAFGRWARTFIEDPASPAGRLAWVTATLLFAVSPYVLYELVEGRPTQAILLFPVLFLHQLWRLGLATTRGEGLRAAAWGGLWLALTGYQYWYYALFGGILAIGHALARLRGAPAGAVGLLLHHVALAAVALGLCLPGALPLLLATMDGTTVHGLLVTSGWGLGSAPLVTEEGVRIGMFLWQALSGSAGFFIQDEDDGEERYLPSLFAIPLILLPVFLAWLREPGRLHRGPVVVMVVVGALIAAGPMLVLFGTWVLPNPLYILLATMVRFIRRLWWPGRMLGFITVLAYLPLAVVLERIARRWPGVKGERRAGLVAGVVVCYHLGLGAWALMVPLPTWSAAVPAGYRCLATGPEGAVLELPYAWTQAHLYYQTTHGRPIFGGMIEDNSVFAPEEFTEVRTKNTFVVRLTELARRDDDVTVWTEADKAALKELGYRYILLQKDAYAVSPEAPPAQISVMRSRQRLIGREFDKLLGKPVFEDARVAIWAPWGDGSPCDLPKEELDTTLVMHANHDPVSRVGSNPDTSVVTWVLADTSETTDATTTQTPRAEPTEADPTKTKD